MDESGGDGLRHAIEHLRRGAEATGQVFDLLRVRFTDIVADLSDDIAGGPAGQLFAAMVEEQDGPAVVENKDRFPGLGEPGGQSTDATRSGRHVRLPVTH